MVSLKLILLVLAFLLLLLQGLNVPNPSPRVSLGWLGLACWVLSYLIS